jgi:tetratricopeptide (TPR) repeat protein
MRTREKSVREISDKLKGMGDYVKMGYLKDCLRSALDLETRRFVLSNLSAIYEKRNMMSEAAKLYRALADLNLNKDSRVNDLIKSVELFIRAGMFEEAEITYHKALSSVKEIEKQRVIEGVKGFYLAQAKNYSVRGKRRYALQIYEKILKSFNLNVDEKRFVNTELLELYKQLGKVREFLDLNKKI